jgi:hypothetical protein
MPALGSSGKYKNEYWKGELKFYGTKVNTILFCFYSMEFDRYKPMFW